MTSSFPFRGCNTGVVGAGNQGKKHEKGQQSHTHAFSQQKEGQRTKGNQSRASSTMCASGKQQVHEGKWTKDVE